MKYNLLLSFLFLFPLLSNGQGTQEDERAIRQLSEDFRVSIIERNDSAKFSSLFLHDSISWAAIVTGKTKEMIHAKKPDFTFVASDFKSFYKRLKEGSEEKFYSLDVTVRNQFATVSFDYSFVVGEQIQNWGTEY